MTNVKQAAQVNGGAVGLQLVEKMQRITLERIGREGIENAHRNLAYLAQGKSLAELRGKPIGKGDRAIIIAAGPSLHRKDVAGEIKRSGFEGAIIATDSAMLYCLRHGIVPSLVVTLDPHATRIVRWFGDPALTTSDLEQDDYFARQDMDRKFSDELKTNKEVLELLDRYGHQIRIALATSSSEAVVRRTFETGMDVYWFNPMYDDPSTPNGMTQSLYQMNGLPCVNTGGNVGAACWMLADAVLNKKHVAVTGMDFSYYDGTPYINTQYYYEAINLVGADNLDSFFIRILNPFLDKWFYTDPAYMWYRNIFLEMAADASCTTYNCTEGGILFGENINFVQLKEFLVGG